ncbi:MAG: hypothetical protein GF393_04705, partial [Armatimonadia bacterium]|nr:hypothetical protein [Armatimonadia bacterium]
MVDIESSRGSVQVAALGAAFSANKGAAAMMQSLIDNLPEYLPAPSFDVLTPHPGSDRKVVSDDRVQIVSLTPLGLVLVWTLALLAAGLRMLRLPWRWLCRTAALRALARADVVVDVAGISFVDGRGLPILVYNTLMTSLPLLLGRPTVKAAQALGPMRRPTTRVAARMVLPRLDTICARGSQTAAHLGESGFRKVELTADLAFTLHPGESSEGDAARTSVGIVPSRVVEAACTKQGIDYHGVLTAFVTGLLDDGTADEVVLIPHSAIPGRKPGRMNDLPLCRDLHHRVDRTACHLAEGTLDPHQLRDLIAACDVLVTSRFHAMISALATATPVLVIGWSHKYREVMEQFDLAEHV